MRLQTEGIVIRETTTGENDRIVTLLTKDMGVLRAFANGAKTMRSRSLSGTQLLCYSKFSIYSGRDAYVISEAQPIEVFFELRNDIERLALAQYFCELSAELAPREDEAPEELRLILNSLHYLAQGRRPQPFLKALTELRLLCMAGYQPNLVACADCGSYDAEPMYFNVHDGTLRCSSCGGKGIALSRGVLTAMRYICYVPFEKLYRFTLSDDGLRQLANVTERYLTAQLNRGFKTLDFYNTLKT